MAKPNQAMNKLISLKIIQEDEKGIKFTKDWQKLVYNSLQKSAKQWHDAGRVGKLDIFTNIEKLLMNKFPNLDPLLEIEMATYVTGIAKHVLSTKIPFIKWTKDGSIARR